MKPFFFFLFKYLPIFMFFGKNQVKYTFLSPEFYFILFLISISLPDQQSLKLLGPPEARLTVGSFTVWRK